MKTLKQMLAALALLLAVTTTASAETITLGNLSNVYVDNVNYGAVEDVLANCPEYTALLTTATIDWLNENLPHYPNQDGTALINRVQNAGIVIPQETLDLLNPPPEEP